MSSRRDFITLLGGAATWPLAAHTQEVGRTYRLGFVLPIGRQTPPVVATDKRQVASMRELLAKFIISMVEQGERDSNRLIESALVRLRIIFRHDAGVGEASKTIKAQDEQVLSRSAPESGPPTRALMSTRP
jgi:hypothetical protein